MSYGTRSSSCNYLGFLHWYDGVFFQVCDFIQRRDGHRADPDNIFLTNGASEAVRLVLRTAIRGPSDGVMVPVPQVRAFRKKKAVSSRQAEGTPVGFMNGSCPYT